MPTQEWDLRGALPGWDPQDMPAGHPQHHQHDEHHRFESGRVIPICGNSFPDAG